MWEKWTMRERAGAVFLALMAVLVVALWINDRRQVSPPVAPSPYKAATGNLWEGVTIYASSLGDEKVEVGTIQGFESQPERRVKIRRTDGEEVWMPREQLLREGLYWVRTNDPFLKEK